MKFYFKRYFTIVLLLLSIVETRVTPYQKDIGDNQDKTQLNNIQIKHILQYVQQSYAPDLTLAVFNISYTLAESGIILRGEVDNINAKNAVILGLRKIANSKVIDSIHVLPDSALRSNIMGIVLFSVANVRRKPGKQEELLTQALMGTVVKLLKKERGYYFIQTPDHYLGWLDTTSIFVLNQTGVNVWNNASKVMVIKFIGVVHTQPDTSSAIVCEIIDGCVLKSIGKKNGWIAVELADGRNGYVDRKSVV
jgi:gamma-D-glutamyl-L-lysine dipeptidyl-peptidase